MQVFFLQRENILIRSFLKLKKFIYQYCPLSILEYKLNPLQLSINLYFLISKLNFL
jgi:hypothetical protein